MFSRVGHRWSRLLWRRFLLFLCFWIGARASQECAGVADTPMLRVTQCNHSRGQGPIQPLPATYSMPSYRQSSRFNESTASLRFRSVAVEHPVGMLEFSIPSLPPVSFGPIPSLSAQIPSIPTLGYPCCLSCCAQDCCCCGCSTLPTRTTYLPSRLHSQTVTVSASSSTTPVPTSPPFKPTSTGSFCRSGNGIEARWVWIDEASGLVQWQFRNPTATAGTVVLNRGVLGSGWYAFGNAFWPAYLETGLTHIGTGPYAPIHGHVQNLPLAVIGPQQPGVAFVFPLSADTLITVDEGGYIGAQPYCHELVDVRFLFNAAYQITYNVGFQCHDFAGTAICPPNPYTNTFPVYEPIDGSMRGAYGPSSGDLLLPAIVVRFRPGPTRPRNCLPGNAHVHMSDGSMKVLRELRVGEWIWTRSLSNPNRSELTRVYAFADYDPDAHNINYVRLVTDRGAVELSPEHLVPTRLSAGATFAFVPATDLGSGAALITEDGESTYVRRIETVRSDGAFAPLTDAGTFLANGHLVSCYSGRVSQKWAHRSFLPLRLYHRAMKHVTLGVRRRVPYWTSVSSGTILQSTGVHVYARWLMRACRMLGPFCPLKDDP